MTGAIPNKATYARRYAELGFPLIPIPHGEKGPRTRGWPNAAITAPEEAEAHWQDSDEGMGVVLGPAGLVSIDVDDPEQTRALFAELGLELDELLAGAPRWHGNPERFKVLFRAPQGPDLGRHALAWPSQEGTGKHTVFELRAGAAQDVLPPSIHPGTGQPYEWESYPSSVAEIPELPGSLAELWRNWDAYEPELQRLCPWQAPGAPQPAARPAEGLDVIGEFNMRHGVRGILEAHGYVPKGSRRWIAPGSSSGLPGVVLLDEDRVYSHHGSCPLADGHAHDAFSVYSILAHGGDTKAAVKEAARDLGMGHDFRSRPDSSQEAGSSASEPASREGAGLHGPCLISAADIQPEEVRWLWPDHIPLGKLTLIAGDPGLGKSFLGVDLAARVSAGQPWPDGSPGGAPGGAILMNAEDDPADTIVPRLRAAGGDPTRVSILAGIEATDSQGRPCTRPLSLDSDVPQLEEALRRVPNCRLLVVDPISAYMGNIDAHKNADVRSLLTELADLAQRWGIAIVAITHLNKGQGKAIYRSMDSLAFVAAARTVWALATDSEDPDRRLLGPMKNNLGQDRLGRAFRIEEAPNSRERGEASTGPSSPVLHWEDAPVAIRADELLAQTEGGRKPTKKEEASDWLLEELGQGPQRVRELQRKAEADGHHWDTVKKAGRQLNVQSKKQGIHGGWVWELPQESPGLEEGSASSNGAPLVEHPPSGGHPPSPENKDVDGESATFSPNTGDEEHNHQQGHASDAYPPSVGHPPSPEINGLSHEEAYEPPEGGHSGNGPSFGSLEEDL